MKILWTLGGAALGKALLGKWGMVAGGGLGYWLAPRSDAEGPKTTMSTTRRSHAALVDQGGTKELQTQERYPEETIIDAMLEGEDAGETARRDEEVAG